MLNRLYQLLSGVVLIAAILTGAVYLWALNSSTIYQRAERPNNSKALEQ